MCRTSNRSRSSSTSLTCSSRQADIEFREVISFTPMAVRTISYCADGVVLRKWPSSAVVHPVFAINFQLTLKSSVRDDTSCPTNASVCVDAPTPAAEESPATRIRSGMPVPLLPWRGPLASGSLGTVIRTQIPWTIMIGKRHPNINRWIGEGFSMMSCIAQ